MNKSLNRGFIIKVIYLSYLVEITLYLHSHQLSIWPAPVLVIRGNMIVRQISIQHFRQNNVRHYDIYMQMVELSKSSL